MFNTDPSPTCRREKLLNREIRIIIIIIDAGETISEIKHTFSAAGITPISIFSSESRFVWDTD